MEDKQLKFHQPLLSLRHARSPSPAPAEKDKNKKDDHSLLEISPISSCKSELKAGHIRDAGTVPFAWEQSPGRPKDESKAKKANQSPVIVPKLPHGRIVEIGKQNSIKLSGSKHGKEGSYGLHWVSISKENESKVESTRDVMESEDSDTREGDEEYWDAPNAISRTELNFSFSGISDLDGSNVNTYENFSLDPQTLEFTMDRFLTAAKAMTYEAPQYSPRRQPVVQEQTRPISKVVNGDKSLLRYGTNVENEEEESDDEYDVQGQLPVKACGLLPHFCFKSSSILLNPLPRMHGKMRGQLSTGGSSSAGSCSNNVNEGGEMPSPQNELPQPMSYAEKPLSSHDYELPRHTFSEIYSAATTRSKVLDIVNNGFEGYHSLKAENKEKTKESYSKFLIPPPLPKSPSDSWLSRTLLSMGPRTPSLQEHISIGIRRGNHAFKTSSVDHKWETIVRSTRDHHRQEPLATIPEN